MHGTDIQPVLQASDANVATELFTTLATELLFNTDSKKLENTNVMCLYKFKVQDQLANIYIALTTSWVCIVEVHGILIYILLDPPMQYALKLNKTRMHYRYSQMMNMYGYFTKSYLRWKQIKKEYFWSKSERRWVWVVAAFQVEHSSKRW